jgi:bifunctional DNase/RNase
LKNLLELTVLSLTPSSFGSNSFILLLQDVNDATRMFPIVIGTNEAQSISIVRDQINISRPLTHQLFHNLLVNGSIKLDKIVIVDFKEGIFYSNMYLSGPNGKMVLDARPSDAIAIALRTNSPIFINEDLFDSISIPIEQVDEELELDIDLDTHEETISSEELSKQLEKALFDENYELAAQLRDSLKNNK